MKDAYISAVTRKHLAAKASCLPSGGKIDETVRSSARAGHRNVSTSRTAYPPLATGRHRCGRESGLQGKLYHPASTSRAATLAYLADTRRRGQILWTECWMLVGATGIEPVTPAMSTPRQQRKNKRKTGRLRLTVRYPRGSGASGQSENQSAADRRP